MSYTWDQNIHYVSITIPIDKTDNILVNFSQQYIKITINGKIYKESPLIKHIKTDESFWYKDGNQLVIELAKRDVKDDDSIWNKCFPDEEYEIRNFDVDIKDVSEEYLSNIHRNMINNVKKNSE